MNDRLPPPSHLGIILGALLTELERLNPGTIQRMRDGLAEGVSMAMVSRIRGPKGAEANRRAFEDALVWMDATSFIAAATLAAEPPKKPKKRRS